MRRLFPVSLLALALVLLSVVPATSQFCLASGTYASTPSISYSCYLGSITFNVTSWAISIDGSAFIVRPSSGHVDPLVGEINCQTGAFTASKTILASGCSETYTLTGQVQTAMSWTGTFKAQYTGPSCLAGSCTNQSWSVSASLVPSGVDGSVPSMIARMDVGPNPWNPATRLRVHLESRQFAQLSIRDITGREVATILDGAWLDRGVYAYQWNGLMHSGERAPSGIYFVHLRTSELETVAKLLVLK